MREALLLAALVLASLSQPARAQFCPGVSPWVFDDVVASDPFCGFITWMAENGITLGCVTIDANHRLYCPADNVTRKQMAAFMNRLGNVRVEAVDTGPGLTGGPITSTGTINLATTQLLPTTACASNQIPRWNGSAWTCSSDANSGGTVTSVGAGTGLTGGPITTSGTLSVNTTTIQARVTGGCAVGNYIRAIAADGTVTCGADNAGPANAYVQNGNAFGATAVLGTTDDNAIDVRVNGARVVRYEPNSISPNIIGGSPANNVTAGVRGATIGGGGVPVGDTDPNFTNEAPNRVTDAYGTVAGGYANRAGDGAGTTIDRPFATVGGGFLNVASGQYGVVGGGWGNTASGDLSFVGGGYNNAAGSNLSVVGGGNSNNASNGGSVTGGIQNTASGFWSTVAGGSGNTASGSGSFAGGSNAKTQTPGSSPTVHDGTFVWADSNSVDFNSQLSNEFAVRASGGVRFVTWIDGSGNALREVKVTPNGEVDFGSQTRQMLNLWGSGDYGIGVQSSTLYYRVNPGFVGTTGGFSWYLGGTHNDNANDAGGGVELMRLARNGTLYVTGGTVGTLSDKASKQDFAAVDAGEVLAKVARLPLTTWSYKANPGVRHIGPTAQDFGAAFGLGDEDARSISMVDADGVALAAIQGLDAKLEARNGKLEAKVAEQAREIAELKRAVEVLLARTSPQGQVASR